MKIKTEKEARAAVKEICKFLASYPDGGNKIRHGEKESVSLSRELCYKLLDASKSYGCCGCPLCEG